MSDAATSHRWRWRYADQSRLAQRQIAALTTLLAPHVRLVPEKQQAAFEEWLPGAAERVGVSTGELRAMLGWLAVEEAAQRLVQGKQELLPDAERMGAARSLLTAFKTDLWEAAGRPKPWWVR